MIAVYTVHVVSAYTENYLYYTLSYLLIIRGKILIKKKVTLNYVHYKLAPDAWSNIARMCSYDMNAYNEINAKSFCKTKVRKTNSCIMQLLIFDITNKTVPFIDTFYY